MDRSDASALADLQMHWDEAYVIGLDGDIWSARYRTSADELRAHTSTELRELIRSDYSYRQKADRAPDQNHNEDEATLGDALTCEADDDLDEDDGDEDDGDEDDRDEDAACAGRVDPEPVDFATIRGERMST